MTENLTGWSGYEWLIPRACRCCHKMITRGIIRVQDRGRELKEDFRTVCWSCFYDFPKEEPEEAPE